MIIVAETRLRLLRHPQWDGTRPTWWIRILSSSFGESIILLLMNLVFTYLQDDDLDT